MLTDLIPATKERHDCSMNAIGKDKRLLKAVDAINSDYGARTLHRAIEAERAARGQCRHPSAPHVVQRAGELPVAK